MVAASRFVTVALIVTAQVFGLAPAFPANLAAASVETLGPVEAPAPVALAADELARLAERQEADLQSTAWAKAFDEISLWRAACPKAAPLSVGESQSLEQRHDAALDDTVALGESSAGRRILWFIPDRIVDCLDMVSAGFLFGPMAGAEAHLTRWASLGAHAGVGGGPLWYYNRNLALAAYIGALACIGPLQTYMIYEPGFGTGWTQGRPGVGVKHWMKKGAFSLDDDMVRDGWVDPWGVGGMFFYWTAEIHPIEIADFVAGLFTLGFVDFVEDDYANLIRASHKIGAEPHYRY
jgi:hypothetical protein